MSKILWLRSDEDRDDDYHHENGDDDDYEAENYKKDYFNLSELGNNINCCTETLKVGGEESTLRQCQIGNGLDPVALSFIDQTVI